MLTKQPVWLVVSDALFWLLLFARLTIAEVLLVFRIPQSLCSHPPSLNGAPVFHAASIVVSTLGAFADIESTCMRFCKA